MFMFMFMGKIKCLCSWDWEKVLTNLCLLGIDYWLLSHKLILRYNLLSKVTKTLFLIINEKEISSSQFIHDEQERATIMMKFADLIDENIEELAALDCVDAGKLFSMGKAVDIPQVANCLRYYAGAADKIHGEVLKMSRPLFGYTLREPIGVVGHIIPWNFPSTMFFMKVAPAMAAGCTMIVKPAEQTPLSALFYAHLAKQVTN